MSSAASGSVLPSPHLLLSAVLSECQPTKRVVCDVCGAAIDGDPAGVGLLIWARGDERREEELPLCEACATAVAAASGTMWTRYNGE